MRKPQCMHLNMHPTDTFMCPPTTLTHDPTLTLSTSHYMRKPLLLSITGTGTKPKLLEGRLPE